MEHIKNLTVGFELVFYDFFIIIKNLFLFLYSIKLVFLEY